MSHEIRTPMNAIMGMTDLALDTVLTAEQREYLDLVRSSTDALLDVVNDILELSKIEAGKIELHLKPFRLRPRVDTTVRTLAARAREKHVVLSATVDASVPDTLVGDAGRLRQVLVNLIGNAIKFTERGEVAVHIATAAPAAGESLGVEPRPDRNGAPALGSEVMLHCSVRDTGIGIPADKQQLIFEPFEQGDHGARRRFGGTGLGLTISKRLVELMGGRIWLESTLGTGSTFHFTARLGVAAADAVAADDGLPMPTTAPTCTSAGGPLDILLAEDNLVNQRLAVRLLEKRGHRVVVVGNGRAAVDALAAAPFDLVLMDVEMPEMDGLTATALIRERQRAAAPPNGPAPHVAIIAMTAHAMRSDEERCLAAGMDGYVTKPIRAATLFATIERIVGAEPERVRPMAADAEPVGSAA